MAWVIARDLINSAHNNDVGMGEGPGNVFVVHKPIEFRLYDGDKNLNYIGYISYDQLMDVDERAFAPLDWAKANVGCAEMQYIDPVTGKWEVL